MMVGLDIETSNYSHEIGGWHNTCLFEPTVVAMWDGENGTVFCNKSVEGYLPENTDVKALHPKKLGKALDKYISNGYTVLGHNVKKFDLPILRDSLDCWTAGDLLSKRELVFDTSVLLKSIIGHAVPLADAVHHTLKKDKLMQSHDAPIEWRRGQYGKVAEYCLKDAQLVYELWEHGKEEGFIKARCRLTGDVKEYKVDW
jgi:hypothetical protein